MKHTVLFILLLIATSCVNSIQIGEEDKDGTATLRVSAYVVSSLTRSSLSDGAKQLSWLVVDGSGSVVFQSNQSSETTGFGALEAELPYGSYKLYAVAHNQSSPCSISRSGIASFAETKLTDTFCKMRSFTLEKDGKDTLQVHMPRSVARFSIKCTDAIPANAATMEIKYQPGGDRLDIATGIAEEDPLAEYQRTIVIPSSSLGKTGISFSFFTFLPATDATLYVKATCKDAEGATLYEREFTGVPLSINHQTTYTGEFFKEGTDLGGSFGVLTEWGEEKNFEF